MKKMIDQTRSILAKILEKADRSRAQTINGDEFNPPPGNFIVVNRE